MFNIISRKATKNLTLRQNKIWMFIYEIKPNNNKQKKNQKRIKKKREEEKIRSSK